MTAIQILKSDLRASLAQEASGQMAGVPRLESLFFGAGLQALLLHRFAHKLYRLNLPFLPRFISHINRFLTRIEIHPGAQIGQGVVIRGGLGVVISETAIIGDRTTIYEGVTLGGTGKDRIKRHPTLGRNVIIEAGAIILGNITIGEGSVVGAGAVVSADIRPQSRVVGIPGRAIAENIAANCSGQPYLETELIQALMTRMKALEAEIQILQGEDPYSSSKLSKTTVDAVESDRLIENFCDGLGI